MKNTLAIWFVLMGLAWAQSGSLPVEKSRVVLVERPEVVNKFAVDAAGVSSMFIKALQTYTGQTNVGQAWHQLGIDSGDVVGIKVNANMGQIMSTRHPLVDVVVETLQSAGVSPQHIFIWDKFGDDLENSGWLPQHDGEWPVVRSVIPGAGYDGKQFYVNEIMGKLIWGDFLFRGRKPTKDDLLKAAENVVRKHSPDLDPETKKNEMDEADQTSNKSYFTTLVTQGCTKIINIPVMSDSIDWGINGCLSSLTMASMDNTRRFASEGVNGDPAIPEAWDRDIFRKKVVLNIMDGIIAEFAGGPEFVPHYTRSAGVIYLSADPVAIDSLVVPRIEAWRKEAQVVPLGGMVRYIKTAARQGLGVAEGKDIELIEIK